MSDMLLLKNIVYDKDFELKQYPRLRAVGQDNQKETKGLSVKQQAQAVRSLYENAPCNKMTIIKKQ